MASLHWIVAIVAIVTSLYFYFKHKYSYWSNLSIKGPPPVWGVGNIIPRLTRDLHQLEIDLGRKYGKVYGTYFLTSPVLAVANTELVKQVLIKDFHHFTNRIQIKAYHELWNKNLFSSNDEDWKRLRMITSPSFSSGKLRGMNSIMRKSIDKLDSYFDRLSRGTGSGVMDTKQTIAGFTIDVIAATSFATETNANDDKENPFVVNGRKLFDINPLRGAAFFLLPSSVLKLLGIDTFFPPKRFQFFINVARHIVTQRKSGQTEKRNDLVQLLMDASVDQTELDQMNYNNMIVDDEKDTDTKEETDKKDLTSKRKLTESEIVANCIFFFVAGYETTASTLSHCIYELACNPDIQKRLSRELHQELDKFTGEESSEEYFDTVMNKIPYLEAVIKETLRKYPAVSTISRICSKDGYKLGDIPLFKDQIVFIPISAIHHDPEYYPEPDRYNPDRFMPENKHLLVPYAYLPFALGPRNCIAMRFAYQEIKLCLAQILQKYQFDTTPETPAKLAFKAGSGLLIANPFPIKVSKR